MNENKKETIIDEDLMKMVEALRSIVNYSSDIVLNYLKDYTINQKSYNKDPIYNRSVNESIQVYSKGYLRCLQDLKTLASK